MINLSKTFCRKFAIDVMKIEQVPTLGRTHHQGIKKGHSRLTFTDDGYYYTLAFMRTGINEIWVHVVIEDEEEDYKVGDYVRTYEFNWETGEAGKCTYDSRAKKHTHWV